MTLELKDSLKTYTHDQDKVIFPQETLKKIRERLKGIDLDILKETRRIDSGRLEIPVYISFYGVDASEITGKKRQMGKGATPSQAEASASMELIERFSYFSFKKNGPFIFEKYKNIEEKAIPFELIALSVHDDEKDVQRSKQAFSDISLRWTWAYNLTTKKEMLIPFDWFVMINEFNGSAAGNTLEEAIIQGLCEVVERHVSSIVSWEKLITPTIDINSVKDKVALELINKYVRNGIKLYLKDFSLDTGIPTVGALAYDPKTFPSTSDIVFTAGTTTSPIKSLIRALTEVAQLAGDFEDTPGYLASGLPKPNSLEEADYVIKASKMSSVTDLPDVSHVNMKKEIENCVTALAKIGLEVLVANTTYPLLKIPAVYFAVPGAHFRERARASSVCMFLSRLISEQYPSDEAVLALQRLKEIFPEEYPAYFNLGIAHLGKGSYQAAMDYFKRSLRLNPHQEDIPTIYCYLGLCYKELGEYRKAIPYLIEGLKYDEERKDIYNLIGFCFFKLKEYEASMKNFLKAIEIDPGSAIDYANIASNLRELGKIEEAITFYKIALEMEPDLHFAKENLERLHDLTA